jgi:hypothetical protein
LLSQLWEVVVGRMQSNVSHSKKKETLSERSLK